MSVPMGYSRRQIGLHWLVALILVPQFFLHDDIKAAWRAIRKGLDYNHTTWVTFHVYAGIVILALMLWRLSIRVMRGVPRPPEEESAMMKMVATGTHWLLYLLLILLPITGLMSWFGGIGSAAEIHEAMKLPLFALVGLHILGALYQQFVLRTNILARMKRAG
ncbi:cytochrome b562 [mine drainage metagenome]|uniref:Cytochrome b562 n=1 Tax=mine drainage metagenome TaxID=410659 RepID=A0A1J5P7J0_9ZZZZ